MDDKLKSQWIKLADAIGQTGQDILAGAPVTITEKRFADPKVLAIMLMSRSLLNFKGVFALIEQGLIVEARVLVRCCFENGFWVAGLHAEGVKFVRKMLHDEARGRQARGELALSRGAQLLEHVKERLRVQLRFIKKKWPDAKSLNPKGVARSGPLVDGYIIYSQLSADAAHPSVTSLNRHVGRSENGEAIIEVVPTPSDEEITMTWDWACNAMLGVCVGGNQILDGTPAGQQLNSLADRYHALTTQPKTKQEPTS